MKKRKDILAVNNDRVISGVVLRLFHKVQQRQQRHLARRHAARLGPTVELEMIHRSWFFVLGKWWWLKHSTSTMLCAFEKQHLQKGERSNVIVKIRAAKALIFVNTLTHALIL